MNIELAAPALETAIDPKTNEKIYIVPSDTLVIGNVQVIGGPTVLSIVDTYSDKYIPIPQQGGAVAGDVRTPETIITMTAVFPEELYFSNSIFKYNGYPVHQDLAALLQLLDITPYVPIYSKKLGEFTSGRDTTWAALQSLRLDVMDQYKGIQITMVFAKTQLEEAAYNKILIKDYVNNAKVTRSKFYQSKFLYDKVATEKQHQTIEASDIIGSIDFDTAIATLLRFAANDLGKLAQKNFLSLVSKEYTYAGQLLEQLKQTFSRILEEMLNSDVLVLRGAITGISMSYDNYLISQALHDGMGYPIHQFMGRSPKILNIRYVAQDGQSVKALRQLQTQVRRISKLMRVPLLPLKLNGLSIGTSDRTSWYLHTIAVNSMDNHPGSFEISLTFVEFEDIHKYEKIYLDASTQLDITGIKLADLSDIKFNFMDLFREDDSEVKRKIKNAFIDQAKRKFKDNYNLIQSYVEALVEPYYDMFRNYAAALLSISFLSASYLQLLPLTKYSNLTALNPTYSTGKESWLNLLRAYAEGAPTEVSQGFLNAINVLSPLCDHPFYKPFCSIKNDGFSLVLRDLNNQLSIEYSDIIDTSKLDKLLDSNKQTLKELDAKIAQVQKKINELQRKVASIKPPAKPVDPNSLYRILVAAGKSLGMTQEFVRFDDVLECADDVYDLDHLNFNQLEFCYKARRLQDLDYLIDKVTNDTYKTIDLNMDIMRQELDKLSADPNCCPISFQPIDGDSPILPNVCSNPRQCAETFIRYYEANKDVFDTKFADVKESVLKLLKLLKGHALSPRELDDIMITIQNLSNHANAYMVLYAVLRVAIENAYMSDQEINVDFWDTAAEFLHQIQQFADWSRTFYVTHPLPFEQIAKYNQYLLDKDKASQRQEEAARLQSEIDKLKKQLEDLQKQREKVIEKINAIETQIQRFKTQGNLAADLQSFLNLAGLDKITRKTDIDYGEALAMAKDIVGKFDIEAPRFDLENLGIFFSTISKTLSVQLESSESEPDGEVIDQGQLQVTIYNNALGGYRLTLGTDEYTQNPRQNIWHKGNSANITASAREVSYLEVPIYIPSPRQISAALLSARDKINSIFGRKPELPTTLELIIKKTPAGNYIALVTGQMYFGDEGLDLKIIFWPNDIDGWSYDFLKLATPDLASMDFASAFEVLFPPFTDIEKMIADAHGVDIKDVKQAINNQINGQTKYVEVKTYLSTFADIASRAIKKLLSDTILAARILNEMQLSKFAKGYIDHYMQKMAMAAIQVVILTEGMKEVLSAALTPDELSRLGLDYGLPLSIPKLLPQEIYEPGGYNVLKYFYKLGAALQKQYKTFIQAFDKDLPDFYQAFNEILTTQINMEDAAKKVSHSWHSFLGMMLKSFKGLNKNSFKYYFDAEKKNKSTIITPATKVSNQHTLPDDTTLPDTGIPQQSESAYTATLIDEQKLSEDIFIETSEKIYESKKSSKREDGFVSDMSLSDIGQLFLAFQFDNIMKSMEVLSRLVPRASVIFYSSPVGEYSSPFAQYLIQRIIYPAVISVEITKEKLNPVDVAIIRLANSTRILSAQITKPYVDTNSFSGRDNPLSIFLGSGVEIQIKLGYGKKLSDLDTAFIGFVRDIRDGNIMEIVAESYGQMLTRPVFKREKALTVFAGDPRTYIAKALSEQGYQTFGFETNPLQRITNYLQSKQYNDIIQMATDDHMILKILRYNPGTANLYFPYDYWPKMFRVPSQKIWTNFEQYFLHYKVLPGYSVWDVVLDSVKMTPGFIQAVVDMGPGRSSVFFGKPTYPVFTKMFMPSIISDMQLDTNLYSQLQYQKSLAQQTKDLIDSTIKAEVKDIDSITLSALDLLQIQAAITKLTALISEYKDILQEVGEVVDNYKIKLGKSIDDLVQELKDGASVLGRQAPRLQQSAQAIATNLKDILEQAIEIYNEFAEVMKLLDEAKEKAADGDKLTTTNELLKFIAYRVASKIPLTDLENRLATYIENLKGVIQGVYRVSFAALIQLTQYRNYQLLKREKLLTPYANPENQYLPGTRPFQNLFVIPDETIIRNMLEVSQQDVHNTIQLYAPKWSQVKIPVLKWFLGAIDFFVGNRSNVTRAPDGRKYTITNIYFDEDIPQDKRRTKVVYNHFANVPQTRILIGTSELMMSLQEMYKGQIATLGLPNMKPFDYVLIDDKLNDIYGIAQVKRVSHIYSPDRGFITVFEVMPMMEARDLHDSQLYRIITWFAAAQAQIQFFIGTFNLATSLNALITLWGGYFALRPIQNYFMTKLISGIKVSFAAEDNIHEAIITSDGIYQPINLFPLMKNSQPWVQGIEGTVIDKVNVWDQEMKDIIDAWGNFQSGIAAIFQMPYLQAKNVYQMYSDAEKINEAFKKSYLKLLNKAGESK